VSAAVGPDLDRRERYAQRQAVERVLPEPGAGSLLRAVSGEVLVYDEPSAKLNPIDLRAVVMPDGTTIEFQTARFFRG
jgi:hypothetical protein